MVRSVCLAGFLALLSCAHPKPPGAMPPANPCAEERGPADDVLAAFREAVLSYAPPAETDATALDQSLWRHVLTQAGSVLLPRREALHRHAHWDLARLPRESLPDMTTWEHLPTQRLGPKDIADAIVKESAYVSQALLPNLLPLAFWNPVRALTSVRAIAATSPDLGHPSDYLHSQVLERMAPPRIVWANDDPERPRLAIVKLHDIFAASFAYDPALGSYLLQRIEWAKRPAGANRAPTGPVDPAEAALRGFTAAVEAYDTPETGTASAESYTSFVGKAMEWGTLQASRLLAPHAELLHQRARCNLLKLPYRALADTSSWQPVPRFDPGIDSIFSPTATLAYLPLGRWDLVKAFFYLRAFSLARTQPLASYGLRTQLENLAPALPVRANQDVERPVLALVDRNEIFTVTFQWDQASGGYLPQDIRWLERAHVPTQH